jgi:predicted nucleotidyltransferase
MIKMDAYQATARLRKQAAIAHRNQRWQQAQEVAKQASDFLKQEYGNVEVILFGSATERDRFHLTSDIDLAVKGLPPEEFFKVVARLQDISPEFKVDLVQLEYCQESLHRVILEEGKPL